MDANFSSGWRDTRSQENTLPVAIAMGAINGKFRHEGNPGGVPRYTFHDTVVLDRWYQVKSVFIVHVGGTRCVTSSTDHYMNIHARITLSVECIRTCLFLFLFDVEIQLRV